MKRDLNLSRTIDIIKSRKKSDPSESYVASLFKASDSVVLKKIIEESTELVIAVSLAKRDSVLHESADLLFHYLVLLEKLDISLDEPQVTLNPNHDDLEKSFLERLCRLDEARV